MTFKQKTIHGLFWSLFETVGNQGVQFIIGIILARLLLPEDYGITGVLAIFIGIAGVLVDSGFKTSIIRSKDLSGVDCSTIFYVNFLISILIGLLIFLSGESIARFFNKPELVNVTRVFAIIPVINGLGLVQSALLFKNLQFKLNAKISIASNVVSGLIALFLAFNGFSYWALVWRALIGAGIYTILLWLTSNWRPSIVFSMIILKKHFKFSSRLLVGEILATLFNNIYSLIFGKFFSFKELGFYTRGKGFVDTVTKTLSVAIQKVNTPLLSASGDDDNYKIAVYVKLLRATTLLIFPASVLLVAVSEPMIIFLIGEKWRMAIPYVQILAISGMIYPVLNANYALYEVLGRSDIIIKQTIIARPMEIIILLITVQFSAMTVAWGILFFGVFGLFLSFYFVEKVIDRNVSIIMKALLPALTISIVMGISVYFIGLILKNCLSSGILFGLQSILGIIITILIFMLLKVREFELIKTVILLRLDLFWKKSGVVK
ncbi:MAG: lipopolysaccharide biosynthesis protein [Bacteroidales bacterium]|nr:lipopolysaccharide biosynthesis protein [Bacteroidales bacterium]